MAAEAKARPESLDLIVLLRAIERRSTEMPRIGKSRAAREDCVSLGQDPWVAFPSGNVAAVTRRAGRPHVETRFLGLFGPQGALPLATTLDAMNWRDKQDPSFLRFTEILSNRFLQLFFRAFADACAIVQNDRPQDDRFRRYLAAVAGRSPRRSDGGDWLAASGTGHAGLLTGRIRTPAQLSQLVSGVLGIAVRVIERVPTWLEFEPDEQTALGAARSTLGLDTALGARCLSLADKIAVEVRASSPAEYRAFLPGGARAGPLADLVFLALGRTVETEIRLGLPAHLAEPIELGRSGALGWTGWVAPPKAGGDERWRFDARYVPTPTGSAAPEEAVLRESRL